MKRFETMQDILEFAIKMEDSSVRFYSELASTAKSERIKRIFLEFAEEERGHKEKLSKIDVKDIHIKDDFSVTDLHLADYIDPEVNYQSLSYREVLVIGMNREKRSYLLYRRLATLLDNPELVKLFLMLAKEESKHKYRFELEYDEVVMLEN